jgi:hypothetical protein
MLPASVWELDLFLPRRHKTFWKGLHKLSLYNVACACLPDRGSKMSRYPLCTLQIACGGIFGCVHLSFIMDYGYSASASVYMSACVFAYEVHVYKCI